jgi:hypothetical protein
MEALTRLPTHLTVAGVILLSLGTALWLYQPWRILRVVRSSSTRTFVNRAADTRWIDE